MPAKGQDMQASIYLARIIGPVFAVIGVGMLVNAGAYGVLVSEFLNSYAMIFLSGLLFMPVGLAIVHAHRVWDRDWRVIITIFGWLLVIGGAARIVLPQFIAAIGAAVFAHTGVILIGAIVVLALGGFLSFKGYSQ